MTILSTSNSPSATIVCPIHATLTPSKAYISLSADFKTVSVDPALISKPSEIVKQTFTLTVTSPFYSNVREAKYSFDVFITCSVTSLTES